MKLALRAICHVLTGLCSSLEEIQDAEAKKYKVEIRAICRSLGNCRHALYEIIEEL